MKLSDIIKNPDNPRVIKDEKYKKLVKSIKVFPQMMEKRPIVIDENNMILGGNMRYEALKELDKDEIPDKWVSVAKDWTDDQKRQFIIKDNVGFGEWEWEQLANDWDVEELEEWGVDVPENKDKIEEVEGEVLITEEFMESHNYVILYFDNDIDWQTAKELFDLKPVMRKNEKIGDVGTGRVIKGSDVIGMINEN